MPLTSFFKMYGKSKFPKLILKFLGGKKYADLVLRFLKNKPIAVFDDLILVISGLGPPNLGSKL